MNRRLRRRFAAAGGNTDEGASLIMVLAFVTFIGLIAGAMLNFSGASLRGASSTKYRGDVSYDVDGALQAGINQIRNSKFVNTDPAACGKFLTNANGTGTGTALTFPGPNLGQDVVVKCQGGPSTGMDGNSVPVYSTNRPGQALLTLAPSGTNISSTHNGTLNIKGKVSANGGITASPGSIAVQNAKVVAGGSCSGVTSTVSVECNSAASFSDPDYTVATGTMAHQGVPACSGSQKLVKFSPGYYDNAVGLSNIMKGGGCKAVTYWFQPGVYYFDFRNSLSTASGLASVLPSGSDEWSVNDADVHIIGGTLSGITEAQAAAGTVPSLPGSCVSPLTTKTNNGVMFVFGGDSRINIAKGKMELCGQYYADKLPIAVYAAKAGADTGSDTALVPATAVGTSTSGDDPFDNNPAGALRTADSTAATTLNASTAATAKNIAKNRTASLTVSGVVPSGGIPAHSILTKAELVVVHRNVSSPPGTKPDSLKLTVTPNPGSGTALPVVDATPYADTATGNFHTENATTTPALDITKALAPQVYSNGLSNLSVKYSMAVPNTNGLKIDAYLDAVQLVLTWERPSIRPVSSTVNVGGTNCLFHGASCALITTAGNGQVDMYIQGTTYAPQTTLDIALNNSSKEVFRSGIVAWSIRVDINPNAYTGPVIEIPDLTPEYTDVYFTAYACPSDTACSAAPSTASGWKQAGTARVSFTDDDVSDPEVGSRDVKVFSWTTYR
jgi:hypothetical protein